MEEYITKTEARDAVIKQQGLYGGAIDDICERIDHTVSTEVEVIQAKAYAEGIDSERKRISDWCRPSVENLNPDYADCDQFVCSNCGIHLQDWVRIDADDYDASIVHEYVFRFCPHCGGKVVSK